MEQSQRLQSIDALRGFDMLFILGLAPLVSALCGVFPGGDGCWLDLQMSHVNWDGLRHHDTIFPLFLFISGITFPFSYAKQVAAGSSRGRIYRKIFIRALVLCLLGIVYNGCFAYGFSEIRLPSVLGRIGVAWMFAAIIFMNTGKISTRLAIIGAILVGYWAALRFIPVPDAPAGSGPFSFDGNLCGYIDRKLLPGTLCYGSMDPEGVLSVVPAVATALLGMLTGQFVREGRMSGGRKVLCMFGAAAVMLVLGLVWSRWFPIIKALWTSTFVLVVGAYSLAMFALFYWLIDVKGWRKWAFPFVVVGMNPITLYMLERIVNVRGIASFFGSSLAELLPEAWGNVVLAMLSLAVIWLAAYFLYKKKIFLKV